jgi:hypothetical protein
MNRREWGLEVAGKATFETFTLPPYTVVVATYQWHRACGVAKCRHDDEWKDSEGFSRAKGRALKALADELFLADALGAVCKQAA